LIQTAEDDVLRDEGEAYAQKLNEAGVEVISVRYNGMIHDFIFLNPLSHLPTSQAAIKQVAEELKNRL
jgi:acetyl esterase/lipase